MTGDRYTINRNDDGPDVLHYYPSFEQCNSDEMENRERIDFKTADALLATDQVKRCRHCFGVDDQ